MSIINKINKFGAKEELKYDIVYKEQKLPRLKEGIDNVELLHFDQLRITFKTENGILIIPTEDLVAMYPRRSI